MCSTAFKVQVIEWKAEGGADGPEASTKQRPYKNCLVWGSKALRRYNKALCASMEAKILCKNLSVNVWDGRVVLYFKAFIVLVFMSCSTRWCVTKDTFKKLSRWRDEPSVSQTGWCFTGKKMNVCSWITLPFFACCSVKKTYFPGLM